jgi:formyltetrahydrofolate-dependent phosphoribosylglycinamide formyltransferase
MTTPLRIATLISGGGRTVSNLQDRIEDGSLPAEIAMVVSSRPNAKGLQRAKLRGLATGAVPSRDFRRGGQTDWAGMSQAIDELILPHAPDLVLLAGYMCLYCVPESLRGRVMNIHPALLPAFGGQGMYGDRVHQAVLEAGVKVSGCTVHFVSDAYDRGPIILQRTCPVHASDTAEDLADRVFALECEAYPAAINLYADGRLEVRDGAVFIDGR